VLCRLVRSLAVSLCNRLVVSSAQRSSAFWASASSFLSLFTVLIASAYWVMAFSIAFGRLASNGGSFCGLFIHSDCFRSSRWSIALVAVSPFCCWVIILLVAASLALFSCWAFIRSCLAPSHGLMPSWRCSSSQPAPGCVTRFECVG